MNLDDRYQLEFRPSEPRRSWAGALTTYKHFTLSGVKTSGHCQRTLETGTRANLTLTYSMFTTQGRSD